MTLEEFKSSLNRTAPPDSASSLLKALWYDKKGEWTRAHRIVQDLSTPEAAWIHAYLHRKEGDPGNAAYWYRKADKPFSQLELENEWDEISEALLG